MGVLMKIMRVLGGLTVAGCSVLYASEYFTGYDVNQPRVWKQPSQRALEYERAYGKNTEGRATGFYNRIKSALGFQSPAQPRARVSEYEKAYSAAPIVVPSTTQPRGGDLIKAYEAEARKDYEYGQQARKATEAKVLEDYKNVQRAYNAAEKAKEKAYAAHNKAINAMYNALEAKHKAWSEVWPRHNSADADGNLKWYSDQYRKREREYQAALETLEKRRVDAMNAQSDASKAWVDYSMNKFNYRAIKNEGREFNNPLQEARTDERRVYPWYKKYHSMTNNY